MKEVQAGDESPDHRDGREDGIGQVSEREKGGCDGYGRGCGG